MNKTKGDLLVNLASQECFKVISFYAKKARGCMARWIIENRIQKSGQLAGFSEDGYAFNAALSKLDAPVFTRPEA